MGIDTSKKLYLYVPYSDSPGREAVLILSDRDKAASDIPISQIEGIFITTITDFSRLYRGNSPICRRDEMTSFEEKYDGRFLPLNPGD